MNENSSKRMRSNGTCRNVHYPSNFIGMIFC